MKWQPKRAFPSPLGCVLGKIWVKWHAFSNPLFQLKKKKKTCDFLYPGACTLWYTFPPQLGRSCVNIIFTFWEPHANHTKVASSKILACVNSRFSSLLAKERGQNGCFRRLLKSISSARPNWAINRAQKPYPCTLHIPRPVAEKNGVLLHLASQTTRSDNIALAYNFFTNVIISFS